MQQVQNDSTVNKLILLFVFDKMEAPLAEGIVLDICCSSNDWINYMECKPLIGQLIDAGFLYEIPVSGKPLYTITPEGRTCLARFFSRIPTSMRESISQFVKNNRLKYRKKQEPIHKREASPFTVLLIKTDFFHKPIPPFRV